MDRILGFLLIWCGGLTVAVVVMATVITNYRKPSQEEMTTTQRPRISPTGQMLFVSSTLKQQSTCSFIQLTPRGNSWELDNDLLDLDCEQRSLVFRNNSIHCSRTGLYLLYAQVSFRNQSDPNRSVALQKNKVPGSKDVRCFLEVKASESQGTVSVMKIVSLQSGDSVSIELRGKKFNENTYWGLVQLYNVRKKSNSSNTLH